MPTIRVEKNSNYTVMSNYHFMDKRLSWKLKGMLSTMLSLPNDWDYSIAGLTSLSEDGDSATRSGLKELEKYGYLVRKPIREKGKIVDWEYTVFEKPLVENPQLVIPQVENETQYNTKEQNTKEQKDNTPIENCNIVLSYLNEKAGTRYRAVESNMKFIRGRLKDYTLDDLKSVVDKKVAEWKGTNMQQYLRPETLFSPTKFENYLNGLDVKKVDNTKKAVRDYEERTYNDDDFKSLVSDVNNLSLDDI